MSGSKFQPCAAFWLLQNKIFWMSSWLMSHRKAGRSSRELFEKVRANTIKPLKHDLIIQSRIQHAPICGYHFVSPLPPLMSRTGNRPFSGTGNTPFLQEFWLLLQDVQCESTAFPHLEIGGERWRKMVALNAVHVWSSLCKLATESPLNLLRSSVEMAAEIAATSNRDFKSLRFQIDR